MSQSESSRQKKQAQQNKSLYQQVKQKVKSALPDRVKTMVADASESLQKFVKSLWRKNQKLKQQLKEATQTEPESKNQAKAEPRASQEAEQRASQKAQQAKQAKKTKQHRGAKQDKAQL